MAKSTFLSSIPGKKRRFRIKNTIFFSLFFWSSQPTSGNSFGHPQNETPHNRRAQPSRNALFSRSTAPLAAKCSAAPEAAANTKTACRTFPSADGLQLRQRESNTRWGSQSPLPYRLAMAHCRKYKYSRMFPICQAKTSLTKPARSLMIKEKRKGDGLWALVL